MGMIMKDGVPYGGVYPIDDVPTQGSNNAVKSGGVFNSLAPLAPIQNVLGAKNIFTGWIAESNKILFATSDCTPATSYIFSCDEPSTLVQYRLYFANSSGTITEVTNGWQFLSNASVSFTTNSDTVQVTFRLKYANDSATISPSSITSTMIRPVGTDATYAPYAKTNKVLTDNILDIEETKASQDMISDAYDPTHTYNAGDYCIYENTFYRCTTDSTRGPWDSSKWNAVTVAGDLRSLFEAAVKVVEIIIPPNGNAIYDIPAIIGYPYFILIGANNPGVWSWCGVAIYSQFGSFFIAEIHKGTDISVEGAATGIKITNNNGTYSIPLLLRRF